MTLAVRNIALGVDQKIARQADNPLIRAATSRRGQHSSRSRHVDADDGEVTVGEFPDVWATPATDALSAVGVRVGADAFDESHALHLTMVRCFVKVVWLYFPDVASNKSQQAVCSRVARILRQEREKRGLSMNLVAERAGLSQQMVSYVEREMRNPTLETLLRIATALEIDLAKVLLNAQKTAFKSK
jgi:DNA-binding XRE family transcriptional regulator